MKSDSPLKHFLLAFLFAIVCYAFFYHFIEHRRNRKGPWQVTFTSSKSGEPEIVVNQPWLLITNVRFIFTNAPATTNAEQTLLFAQPKPVPFDVPFGKCIFMDTTFLPGTATFQFFGHEIELLPRTLILDHEELAWAPNSAIDLPDIKELPKSRAP